MTIHVETTGEGPRVVLVHGSMGYPSWRKQMALAENFRLEIVKRSGYPPNPPEQRIDFEQDAMLVADQLQDGAHLVGHSYGGVVCMFAAALRPEAIHSLTVTEPPCFSAARGQADVEELVAAVEGLYASGPRDPRDFVVAFMGITGSGSKLPDPLPEAVLPYARALMAERLPWELQMPLAKIKGAAYPKLVVSGAISHPALVHVCDVLEREMGAQRAILPESDHRMMDSPDFNGFLFDFLAKSASMS